MWKFIVEEEWGNQEDEYNYSETEFENFDDAVNDCVNKMIDVYVWNDKTLKPEFFNKDTMKEEIRKNLRFNWSDCEGAFNVVLKIEEA